MAYSLNIYVSFSLAFFSGLLSFIYTLHSLYHEMPVNYLNNKETQMLEEYEGKLFSPRVTSRREGRVG